VALRRALEAANVGFTGYGIEVPVRRVPVPPSGYEILPDILDEEGLVTLSASFTANNGIRVQLLDSESNDADWRVFDFTPTQADQIGAALLRWAKNRAVS
jgi:hypothetical protein